jgi:hypothetical protein
MPAEGQTIVKDVSYATLITTRKRLFREISSYSTFRRGEASWNDANNPLIDATTENK